MGPGGMGGMLASSLGMFGEVRGDVKCGAVFELPLLEVWKHLLN